MKRSLQAAMAAAALVAAGHAAAQITLYEHEGFRGRAVTANDRVWNLDRIGFNDRASSIVVQGGRWEVCEHARFEGRCFILRRGSYPSLRELGLNDQISSLRPVEGRSRWHEVPPPVGYVEPVAPPVAVQPPPPVAVQPAYDWRQRQGEQIFEVPVSSVHAVVGPPNQRCWIERQQATAPSNQNNLGGAVIGGIVGGILGHQVGGGSGRDLATAGGAVAGAVVGSNLATQQGGQVVSRDVQRCDNVTSTTPAYYDVTYFFNGTEHHMQMSQPPGRTVRVNGYGEPRM